MAETSLPLQSKQYRQLLTWYLSPQKRRVALAAVLLLAGIALQLANPQVIRYFLDTAQTGGAAQKLLLAALIYIGFALFQQAMTLVASYTSQRVAWAATNRLRSDLTLHILQLDMGFHKKHTPGELIERIDGDISQLANFFSEFFIHLIGNSLLVIGILIILFRESISVGWGMLLYTAITLVALNYIQRLAVPRWAAARQAGAEQSGYIEERISGREDIRAVGAEGYAIQGLFRVMRTYLEKNRAAFVISKLSEYLTNLVYVAGYAAGLALGVYLYSQHQVSLGTAYLIVYYIGMLETPLQGIRMQVQDLQRATASIQRILGLFAIQSPVQKVESSTPQPFRQAVSSRPASNLLSSESQPGLVSGMPAADSLPAGRLSVCFDRVSFHYESNDNVLNEVSFELPPGKVLGILGRTGSGKSTLSRLLFHLYDPDQGAIRLGGRDLRGIPLAELRQQVGMVTQDVQLFHATVRDNLAFFNRQITDEQLKQVLEELHLWDWIQSLPESLNTVLAGGNQGLSAGEAQLLAFARVFLKDPGLVILDEASSRLDPVTETRLEQAIDRLFAGRTGIIIAHRLKTLQRADEVLILESGQVVEFGSRLSLANNTQSRYAHLLTTGLEEVLK